MRFKIDENLPAEAAEILQGAGFVADTVGDENLSGTDDETLASTSRSEGRILVTLDLDFANIRAYPPGEHAGIIVLRVKHQNNRRRHPCLPPKFTLFGGIGERSWSG